PLGHSPHRDRPVYGGHASIKYQMRPKAMFLGRVEGSVVATKKDPSMSGRKLLLLRPQLVDEKDPTKFRPGANTIVAVDSVGAGIGELVMFCQGSSARLAPNLKDAPVDADRKSTRLNSSHLVSRMPSS